MLINCVLGGTKTIDDVYYSIMLLMKLNVKKVLSSYTYWIPTETQQVMEVAMKLMRRRL